MQAFSSSLDVSGTANLVAVVAKPAVEGLNI